MFASTLAAQLELSDTLVLTISWDLICDPNHWAPCQSRFEFSVQVGSMVKWEMEPARALTHQVQWFVLGDEPVPVPALPAPVPPADITLLAGSSY